MQLREVMGVENSEIHPTGAGEGNGGGLAILNHRDLFLRSVEAVRRRVVICAGTGCVANGALKVQEAFEKEMATRNLPIQVRMKLEQGEEEEGNPLSSTTWVSGSGCQGFCQMGPLVTILPENILYCRVRPEDVAEIVEKTLCDSQVVERLLYRIPGTDEHCRGPEDIPFYARQCRQVLDKCGLLDPTDIREYIAHGGYQAAQKAFTAMEAAGVCSEVLNSGLRGRGGGGFPTGRKWELTRIQPEPIKYVICNGDEGDPGAFMDRSLMEGNPHAVIEGMLIAARAIGAEEGVVYVRAEYPLAVQRVRHAVREATECGLLGAGLFGTGHRFHIQVVEGAGAFVCGEETALIASIEGERGMPRPKPPFPAECGLWGKPTVINNVETLGSIPGIIRHGADHYRKLGTTTSPGTKTFALTGHVANTGLIEVPFGSTLRTIVNEIGGGITDNQGNLTGEPFKAVQIGGPSGGCLTPEHLDLPLDFDSLQSIGAMVGSGGLVVMNPSTCMVQVARFFMQFTQNESCGKCIPCREGTRQMLALLDDVMEGVATEETLDLMDRLSNTIRKASLCGLGKTAPNPVLSTLTYFRDEVEAHVLHKTCPAGQCKALLKPEIIADKCKGCTICIRKCPTNAIIGERRQPHRIEPEKCIKCMACIEACKFDAITTGGA